MRTLLIATLALPAGGSLAAADEHGPPMRVSITVDGKTYESSTIGEFTATVDGKQVAIAIRELPTRHFRSDGIEFDYPSQHAFKVEREDETTTWTLDGQDNIIMVFKVSADPAEYFTNLVPQLIKQYQERNVKVEGDEMTFGTITAPGKKLAVNLAGTKLVQEAFLVADGHQGAIVLIQGTPGADGAEMAETAEAKRLLRATFRFTPESAPDAKPESKPDSKSAPP